MEEGSKNKYYTIDTFVLPPLLFCMASNELASEPGGLICRPRDWLPLGLGGPVEQWLGGRLLLETMSEARDGSGVVSLDVGGA